MIIVDTNVISEALKPVREPAVIAWLDAQVVETLYLTSPGLSELALGTESLPDGKRKEALRNDLDNLLRTFFGVRILPFDKESALIYGKLIAVARKAGRAISVTDGQIGAIASLHKFSVATRDTSPFTALSVHTINPWSQSPAD
jgi:predicted nucleic acid-binding protein